MAIEHIRLSQQAKDHLIRLKSKTGINQWNIICRWAFCISLAEASIPPLYKIPSDSNVEMTWKIFGGHYHNIYYALLVERCKRDGLEISDDALSEQFKAHLNRGIGYLFGDKNMIDISSLIKKICPCYNSLDD